MSVWVVVGGQYGSEGKGKVSAIITLQEQIDLCIRCGGPNSGHSFVDEDGSTRLVRQIPTGFVSPSTRLLIPAGGVIDLDVLRSEIAFLGLGPERLGIDTRAMVVTAADKAFERDLRLGDRLSSTLCGVGSAVSRRVLRGADVILSREASIEHPWLRPYLTDTASEAHRAIQQSKKILIEGTQGFGLSLYHSSSYPKTTSRDTTAAGFLSEAGISPLTVTQIVVVFRTFPIRVAGTQAGPMENEITWETLQDESGYPHPIQELTSVTQRVRRVARFDWELAMRAVAYNQPTMLAVNGLDYLSFANRGVRLSIELEERAQAFLKRLESVSQVPVVFRGTGPALCDQALPTAPSEVFDLWKSKLCG
jgi:adenylosuccinate synthase